MTAVRLVVVKALTGLSAHLYMAKAGSEETGDLGEERPDCEL